MTANAFTPTVADSALLVVDMQERFQSAIPSIAADGSVGKNTRILMESARLLDIPTLISEQYPKGLGHTLPFLSDTAGGQAMTLSKTHFSCCDDAALMAKITSFQRPWWIVCGIETHVCILATVADLLNRGHQVIVVGDAVDSRRADCRIMALQTARDIGAVVLPTEAVVFRWLRNAHGDAFKRISALVR